MTKNLGTLCKKVLPRERLEFALNIALTIIVKTLVVLGMTYLNKKQSNISA